MKKAKFALTAVAILAVIGGALAFRASNPTGVNLFYKLSTQPNCTLPVNLTTVVKDAAGITTIPYHTTTIAGTCPGVRVTPQS